MSVATNDVVVSDPQGLHARPAAQFAKMAKSFPCDITLNYQGDSANAKSMMAIMKLGVRGHSTVNIEAEGENAQDAVNALSQFLTD